MFRTSFLSLFLLFSLSATVLAQTGPSPGRLPSVQRDVLLTDLPVLVASRPGSTSVTVSVVVKVGSTFDRAGKAGLARLTAETLLAGGGGYNTERIKLELEENQAQLDLFVDWDMTRLSITGPARNVTVFLELLGTLLTTPDLSKKTFLDTQFQPFKQAQLEIVSRAASPGEKGDELFFKTLYGAHPYHHSIDGTPESVQAITRFDVAEFWKRHYMPNNAAVIIVGDVTAERVRSDARKSFGGWVKAKPAPYSFLPPTEISGTKIVLQPDEAVSNPQVRIGWFTTRFPENERLAWLVIAEILKTRFQPEGIAVEMRHLPDSPWVIRMASEPGRAAEVVGLFSSRLRELREKPLTETEIQAAKAAVLKRYEAEGKSNYEIAMVLSVLERYGLGQRADSELPQRIADLTMEQLKPVLEKLGGKGLLVTVYGGSATQKDALSQFGTVSLFETPATSSPVKP